MIFFLETRQFFTVNLVLGKIFKFLCQSVFVVFSQLQFRVILNGHMFLLFLVLL